MVFIGFAWFMANLVLGELVLTLLAMYTRGSTFGNSIAFIHAT